MFPVDLLAEFQPRSVACLVNVTAPGCELGVTAVIECVGAWLRGFEPDTEIYWACDFNAHAILGERAAAPRHLRRPAQFRALE